VLEVLEVLDVLKGDCGRRRYRMPQSRRHRDNAARG